MIEIELKFELKNKINVYLKPDSEKEVEDIYYDTEDYKFLKKVVRLLLWRATLG